MRRQDPEYLERVRLAGCVVCSYKLGLVDLPPCSAHHLFAPHERNDYLTAGLCHAHHQGPQGFHGLGGAPGFYRVYKLSEPDLLALTIASLNERL